MPERFKRLLRFLRNLPTYDELKEMMKQKQAADLIEVQRLIKINREKQKRKKG